MKDGLKKVGTVVTIGLTVVICLYTVAALVTGTLTLAAVIADIKNKSLTDSKRTAINGLRFQSYNDYVRNLDNEHDKGA